MTVRTRFAPSPTGYLHVGGARTALFCWLHARHHGGQFILRIEDTDRERSTPEFEADIIEGLTWLGLAPDEGPIRQSDRLELYARYVARLMEAGRAYHCYCTREELDAMRDAQRAAGEKPRYDGRCRHRTEPRPGVEPVVRFRNPDDGEVVVDDLIRGRMVFANAELDDLVIMRADGAPTYNFSVVVDDLEMAITHVIRGDDHINNTPRQMNIFAALEAPVPAFAHVPMILGPDGQKLSKRHGAVSVTQFREEGFLPDALVNYIARLGWSHGDQEVFSRDELVALFDVADVNRAASVFDNDKLLWLNQHYIQRASAAELAPALAPHLRRLGLDLDGGPALGDVVEVQRDRAKTLVEMADKSVFAFRQPTAFDEKAAGKHLRGDAAPVLRALREAIAGIESWTGDALHEAVEATAGACDVKLGKVAQPLRVALTGEGASPAIEKTLLLVGREQTLRRIDHALDWIAAEVGR
ncbi:MAG: glutamate--tRNA ligase [Ectothiorhodospiraceae bacterium]|nr:glutamate--tRNA ligase [Chromatiales bacterium]MCP5155662.1 glutamate--tRNA ligase [Ectothiorhodospiraceae bacterium]